MTIRNKPIFKAISTGVITVLALQALIMPFLALAQGSVPSIVWEDFSLVSANEATLTVNVNPNGQFTNVRLEYGQTAALGRSVDSNAGSTISQTIPLRMFGLQANTTYYYTFKAWNNSGMTQDRGSFVTNLDNSSFSSGSGSNNNYNYNQNNGASPIVYTGTPSSVTSNSALLNATINPQNGNTNYWFEYGTSTYLGNSTSSQYLGNGNYAVNASNNLYGLQPNTTYYYKAVAVNNYGSQISGSIVSFTTLSDSNSNQNYNQNSGAIPTVTTNSASLVTATSATLNGSVNPNNALTNYWFQYGAGTVSDQTAGFQSLSASSGASNVSFALSGLTPNTAYSYRIAAKNDYGVAVYGDPRTFTTGNNQVSGSTQASTNKKTNVTIVSTFKNSSGSGSTSNANLSANLLSSTGNINPVVLQVNSLRPGPGDQFDYTVNYINRNSFTARNVVLKIILPEEVDYVNSSLPPSSVIGSMFIYNLGDVASNGQVFITVTVKVKDTAKSGTNLIFTVILEYLDYFGNLQSLNSYLTVQVGEKSSSLSGAMSGLIGGLANWSLLLWLALGTFIVWLISYIVYRKYYKNGNGNGQSKVIGYGPPPTVAQ